MPINANPSLLRSLRTLARPSTLLRGLWLMAAVLHAWLIVRRFAAGDWASAMDYVRVGLCLAAVGYTSLKFWQISTIFDAQPRRALVFALLLVVGHALIEGPTPLGAPSAWEQTGQVVMLLAVAPVLGGLLLALTRALGTRPPRPQAVRTTLAAARGALDFIARFTIFPPPLLRRPPPVLV